jgi:uncharacterized protein involved in type VI secretion and phage assembly
MADVNQFSFLWQLPVGEVTLDTLVNFYNENLAKDITISIGSSFTFKGIISTINSVNQSISGAQYEVLGYGQFYKLDQVPYCNSFYKKKYKQIVESMNNVSDAKLTADPTNDEELFYTVQYNQSIFEFYKMMAARYGEWMYYTGTEMKIGNPSGDPITLVEGKELIHVSLNARMAKTSTQTVGYDHYTGERVHNAQPALSDSGIVDASLQAGERAFGDNETNAFISNVPNNTYIEKYNKLKQKAAVANTVQLRGETYMPTIALGGKIKIKKRNGNEIGDYIITEVHHFSSNKSQYKNTFVAVPATIEVPPYTNPTIYPKCNAQYAVVVDNEDKDGLDRIKVRFPWQKESEKTPWLNVIVPHAGKDKGFRFLPEIDEEVMIDFVDSNAEKPFILGAIHTEKTKSEHEIGDDNNTKIIGTKSGRRLEIQDTKGVMALQDYDSKKTKKGNSVFYKNKDGETRLVASSFKDDNNYTSLTLIEEKEGSFAIMKGGDKILEIKLTSDDKTILIKSKDKIVIDAENELELKSKKIKITASQSISIAGQQSVSITSGEVKIKADMAAEFGGLTTKVKADTQLDLSGGVLGVLKAPIVQIN